MGLSVRVDPHGAEISQVSLESLVRRSELDSDQGHQTKTRRVLDQFLAAASR